MRINLVPRVCCNSNLFAIAHIAGKNVKITIPVILINNPVPPNIRFILVRWDIGDSSLFSGGEIITINISVIPPMIFPDNPISIY